MAILPRIQRYIKTRFIHSKIPHRRLCYVKNVTRNSSYLWHSALLINGHFIIYASILYKTITILSSAHVTQKNVCNNRWYHKMCVPARWKIIQYIYLCLYLYRCACVSMFVSVRVYVRMCTRKKTITYSCFEEQ